MFFGLFSKRRQSGRQRRGPGEGAEVGVAVKDGAGSSVAAVGSAGGVDAFAMYGQAAEALAAVRRSVGRLEAFLQVGVPPVIMWNEIAILRRWLGRLASSSEAAGDRRLLAAIMGTTTVAGLRRCGFWQSLS